MSATIIPFPDSGIRRRVVRARFGAEVLEEHTEDEWFWQADHVLDQIEEMLDHGDAREVIALCEQAMGCLLDAAPEIDDGRAVTALIDRLRDLHVRACVIEPPDQVRLAEFLDRLERRVEVTARTR